MFGESGGWLRLSNQISHTIKIIIPTLPLHVFDFSINQSQTLEIHSSPNCNNNRS